MPRSLPARHGPAAPAEGDEPLVLAVKPVLVVKDLIDKGPNSAGVLLLFLFQCLLQIPGSDMFVLVRGNHENP